jgi:hypothetical protein
MFFISFNALYWFCSERTFMIKALAEWLQRSFFTAILQWKWT